MLRHASSASTEAPALFTAFCLGLRLSLPHAEAWWRCLARARWSTAVAFRQQLQAQDVMPITADGRRQVVHEVLTPAACVAVLEALVQERVMVRVQANTLMEQVLRLTDAAGRWKL
jgi:hypothetical protein